MNGLARAHTSAWEKKLSSITIEYSVCSTCNANWCRAWAWLSAAPASFGTAPPRSFTWLRKARPVAPPTPASTCFANPSIAAPKPASWEAALAHSSACAYAAAESISGIFCPANRMAKKFPPFDGSRWTGIAGIPSGAGNGVGGGVAPQLDQDHVAAHRRGGRGGSLAEGITSAGRESPANGPPTAPVTGWEPL
ncbi:hypothetical protein GCM10018963_64780 [Saccharothrix longispora]